MLALVCCALLASCGTPDAGNSDAGNSDAGNPDGGTSDTTASDADTPVVSGPADAEITGLSFGYLTESAYNNGSFSDDSITNAIDPVMETACYMVVDFTIKASANNSGEHSIKIEARVSDGLALTVAVQDAPTGKFETVDNGDGTLSKSES